MFGKESGAPAESKLNSIVGKGSNCQGDIVVAGGLKIDGNFKGTIKADAVFVGKDAVIEATLDTNVAVIGGKILGDVIARQSLELQTKAEIIGNVTTKNLIVAETAVLDGYVDMGQKERHPRRPETAKQPESSKPGAGGPSPLAASSIGAQGQPQGQPASGGPAPTGGQPGSGSPGGNFGGNQPRR